MSEPHGIGWAVKQLQNGSKVARAGWNGKGMFLFLVSAGTTSSPQVPYETPHQPFVSMFTAQQTAVPWLCSQTDLLATDWELAAT
jgi:hypothetical protein